MPRMTKTQCEAIAAGVYRASVAASIAPVFREDIAHGIADGIEVFVPKFKRELFVAQCVGGLDAET